MEREAELRARVAEYPEEPFWPHALGVHLLGAERWAEAEAAFEEALRRNPNYHASYYQLGLLYERMGKEAEAIQAFRTGLKLAEEARDLPLIRDFRARLALYLGYDAP